MSRWWRVGAGLAVLAVVVVRLGTGPFVDAVRATDPLAVLAALAVTGVTTLSCACRWRVVAARFGIDVPLGGAVAAYYRSQLLNATLPGGVVGDVHRAVRDGQESGAPGRSAAAVATERFLGQAVQVVGSAAVLLADRAPALSLVTAIAVAVALVRWPALVGTSLVSAAGHVLVFLVAARAAGTDASVGDLLPLALVVMLAAAIPLNVAGWGPREGVAAWAFAGAGLGAAQGATVAVVYGVLALLATLPGAVLLARGRSTAGAPRHAGLARRTREPARA